MRSRILIALFIAAAAAGIVIGQDSGRTIGLKGLKVPLEYYPDGTLKAVLRAEISNVDATGRKIEGENLRYETYAKGGATDVVITAESCVYDKAKGRAESKNKVKLEKENITITGKGFTLDSKKEIISLHSEVVVEFDKGLMSREKKK